MPVPSGRTLLDDSRRSTGPQQRWEEFTFQIISLECLRQSDVVTTTEGNEIEVVLQAVDLLVRKGRRTRGGRGLSRQSRMGVGR